MSAECQEPPPPRRGPATAGPEGGLSPLAPVLPLIPRSPAPRRPLPDAIGIVRPLSLPRTAPPYDDQPAAVPTRVRPPHAATQPPSRPATQRAGPRRAAGQPGRTARPRRATARLAAALRPGAGRDAVRGAAAAAAHTVDDRPGPPAHRATRPGPGAGRHPAGAPPGDVPAVRRRHGDDRRPRRRPADPRTRRPAGTGPAERRATGHPQPHSLALHSHRGGLDAAARASGRAAAAPGLTSAVLHAHQRVLGQSD